MSPEFTVIMNIVINRMTDECLELQSSILISKVLAVANRSDSIAI